jgi:hypothetical protein
MDSNGYWTGNSLFSASRAMYTYTVYNFNHTVAEFESILAQLQSQIATMASGATSRTLTENLLYWMSWTYYLQVHRTKVEVQSSFNLKAQ